MKGNLPRTYSSPGRLFVHECVAWHLLTSKSTSQCTLRLYYFANKFYPMYSLELTVFNFFQTGLLRSAAQFLSCSGLSQCLLSSEHLYEQTPVSLHWQSVSQSNTMQYHALKLTDCLSALHSWFCHNGLALNSTKSYRICLLILVGVRSATALLQHGTPFLSPSKTVHPCIVSSAT